MRVLKILTIFMSVWLASSVAFSRGSVAPELQIISQAKSSAEYPVLRRLQDLTLELQLLEITIKNRRDSQIEEKITKAIGEIEDRGASLATRFKSIRSEQLEGLFSLFNVARRFSEPVGVSMEEWDDLFQALSNGALTAGTLTVHGKAGILNVLTLTPLSLGKQVVWNVSLPTFDRKSFWVQAHSKNRHSSLTAFALEKRAAAINNVSGDAEKLAKAYFAESYSKLYSAFETHRYAILQRIQMARNALVELAKNNNAMGAPEEYSSLYNSVLDNLFSYGIDVSLSGNQRDFAVKGFLFADSPEAALELLKKLKYTPSSAAYNSPSS